MRSLAERTLTNPYSLAMQPARAHPPVSDVRLRAAEPGDVEALAALEVRVFKTDRISPRAFRRFVSSPTAALIVATHGDKLAGYALVLFRAGSAIARLYSIAVVPEAGGRGVGGKLLDAAEQAAVACERVVLRLEVHENNA